MAEVIIFPNRLERARLRYAKACRLETSDQRNVELYRRAVDELLLAQRQTYYGDSALR